MAHNSRVTMFVPLSILMVLVISNGLVQKASAAGECRRTPIGSAAASLTKVPPACRTKVNALIGTSPRCLCAVLLSPLAKQAGIMPATAISIPKRCNIKNRPAGKKCVSEYTVPRAINAKPDNLGGGCQSNGLRKLEIYQTNLVNIKGPFFV
ncbi:hypothetical protein ACJRO7_028156 [Eucalyptus globulus]|uniref:Bifunctional inhibitor/plant lipid transfer protein/seed storage helical domain-containing protein n=1 Tax=Eucalyptus globulus TaxID=34317 RepID=A0ABD3K6E6_EUCGL